MAFNEGYVLTPRIWKDTHEVDSRLLFRLQAKLVCDSYQRPSIIDANSFLCGDFALPRGSG
jgi:hypothetical protein